MKLRSLTEKDLPHLILIEEASHLTPWPEEVFSRCFTSGYHLWGVDYANHLTGFVIYSLQVGECHILNICVHPEYQHQGLGYQLLSHALMQAKQQGAEIVYLEVRRSNEHALKLYKKVGFMQVGERKGYYPKTEGREDALVLAKDLRKDNVSRT